MSQMLRRDAGILYWGCAWDLYGARVHWYKSPAGRKTEKSGLPLFEGSLLIGASLSKVLLRYFRRK